MNRELLYKIVQEIESNNRWYVICVGGGNEPLMAYSVGLFKNFGHPEIVIFGISPDAANRIINRIGTKIKEENMRYIPEMEYNDILVEFKATFLPVPKDSYDKVFNVAGWYYKGNNFRVLQLVWPDKNNKFPWEEGFNKKLDKFQPLID